MDIQWHGSNCVSFKGKSGTLLVNPNDAKVSADVVLVNSLGRDHKDLAGFNKETNVFDLPGEYEAKGIFIQGITAYDSSFAKKIRIKKILPKK